MSAAVSTSGRKAAGGGRVRASRKEAGGRKKAQGAASASPAGARGRTYRLRLYVAGQTPKSLAAFANLKKICEEHLAGRYTIEVVDLLENPRLAAGDQIFAIPTLVRRLPQPIKKIIGDLSNTERVLVGLDIR